MKFLMICGLLLAGTCAAPADTIRLASGKNLKAHVVGYTDANFEVQDDKQITTRLPAATVLSIDFEAGTVDGVFQTRTQGELKGKVSLYDKGMFSVQDPKGQIQRIQSIMITKASFDGTGSSAPVKVVAHGERIDLAKTLVNGRVTIVDFYADWCGPCRMAGPQLEKIAKEDQEVVLRKVDIVRWGTPVTQQFNINSIPRIEIYDRNAKLVGTVAGVNEEEVKALIAKAKGSKAK